MLRRSIASVAAGLLAPLLLAAAPAGSATTAATLAKSTKPGGKPTPAHPSGPIRLYLSDAYFVRGSAVTVPRRTVQVGGVVTPFVPGQWVSVQTFLGKRLIKTDSLRVKPSRNGSFGRFTESVSANHPGLVTVKVAHLATPQMAGFTAQRRYAVLDPSAGFGAGGKFVQLIQQRLAALHFYIPRTGVYDQGTGLAIDAYHRLLGWGTSQTLDRATITWLLDGFGSFNVRDPGDGKHVEGNLSKQLLALIYGSHVYAIYPISSGKPSTPTILGHFSVYSRVPGYLPDGMYYSSFFFGGYAIHGYNPAPDYPASHGCMRVPIVDAISIFNWLNYGDVVDVYY